MGEPARRYSWEPFQPGHEIRLTHGARSPRHVDPIAAELVELVSADVDWWRRADQASVWAWARCEARIQLLVAWLADKGDLDGRGRVRPAAELLTRLEKQAESLRARLGLDPLSRARLRRDTAAATADLDRIAADGRAAIEARSDLP